MPPVLHRAVNSWFDYESYLSDLGRRRERMGGPGYRAAVLQVTAEFLELPSDLFPDFVSTLDSVRSDLRKIEKERGEALAAYPVDLGDRDLQRIQGETEDRFEPGRRLSLAKFDRFLDDRERHREFRAWLNTWVSSTIGLDP